MSTTKPPKVSAQTYARIRDYVVEQPSFTIAFAAWELGITVTPIGWAVEQLLKDGLIRQIEPQKGPYAAVYQYEPPSEAGPGIVRSNFPELDEGLGREAPRRGVIVPHTRAVGPSGKPGEDKKRSARGVRVKRARQGT
jgi:predicted DNA-binding transcriptional regulator